MQKITVLVSGGGTNLQAIIDGIETGDIENAKIVKVISSNGGAFSLTRARKHGILTKVIGKETYPKMSERNEALLVALKETQTDLVVLAGYMSVLDAKIIQAYEGKIINIHPSLIPKFCGKGFYGTRVHQAVLDADEKETGATVHYVDEGVDTGEIILQETVPVFDGDSADTLAARVLITEHKILKQAIKKFVAEVNEGGQ